jgi:hypothetical protein
MNETVDDPNVSGQGALTCFASSRCDHKGSPLRRVGAHRMLSKSTTFCARHIRHRRQLIRESGVGSYSRLQAAV